MSNCPECQQSIVSQTPSLIGATKCNGPCPPEVTCTDILPSNCVFYSGSNLTCSGVNYGDTISVSLSKIDSKLGTRIDSGDACCGYLNDKIVVGTGITKTVVTNGNCKTLRLDASSSSCSLLQWHDLVLQEAFQVPGAMHIVSGDTSTSLGVGQNPQYAVEYCGAVIRKIWFRGIVKVPAGLLTGDVQIPVMLVSNTLVSTSFKPQFTRLIPIGMYTLSGGMQRVYWVTFIFKSDGSISLSSDWLYVMTQDTGSLQDDWWLSLDGFSIETN